MAYIIAVNVCGHRQSPSGETSFSVEMLANYYKTPQASILSQTGGTCECSLKNKFQCDTIHDYADCKEGIAVYPLLASIFNMISF